MTHATARNAAEDRLRRIIALRARLDPVFRGQLLNNPRAAVERATGLRPFPAEVSLFSARDTETVMPPVPAFPADGSLPG